jgi:nicotinamidase-related amidase
MLTAFQSNGLLMADDFQLKLRSQKETVAGSSQFERSTIAATWKAKETAIIVCDVWDKHHSINAVRRMEEFVPRMNDLLIVGRNSGATIIHSPSDCMAAYEKHPARQRAIAAPTAGRQPDDVKLWCSKIPAEEQAMYPIDQSDGGSDDDPAEHEKWAAELTALGRNAGLPWQAQSPLVTIDDAADFISDRGDEVWNILEARGIKNVILVGVHTNMCVLGRPFGLRQMVRNGKNVVLMRDLTDCMYNPKQWPYVDHFTGNDLIISHVERFVCPTATSDQILGGQPFVSKYDTRKSRDVMSVAAAPPKKETFSKHWTTAATGSTWKDVTHGAFVQFEGPVWYRCSVRIPADWIENDGLTLTNSDSAGAAKAWLNGVALDPGIDRQTLSIPKEAVVADDINLLVVRIDHQTTSSTIDLAPTLQSAKRTLSLNGRWQFRIGDDPEWSNIPLPAKFGLGSDVLFEAAE